MGFKTPIEELEQRRVWAEAHGGAENVKRQHDQGRLTIRERIAGVLDKGSFQEVGKLTGAETYDGLELKHVTPAPYIMGLGQIDGRPVAVGGEDFTVRGGTTAALDSGRAGRAVSSRTWPIITASRWST
jgi:acetyl-CoA carboxylase carboxyltransferase component